MKKMKYSYLLLFSGVLFLFIQSCSKSSTDSSSLYTPTNADVTASATLLDLQQGRTLYINNCGRCHGLLRGVCYNIAFLWIVWKLSGNSK